VRGQPVLRGKQLEPRHRLGGGSRRVLLRPPEMVYDRVVEERSEARGMGTAIHRPPFIGLGGQKTR
jgi:hypothetical protein